MAKKMLIDATHSEEIRVVVVDGQQVEEFDFETLNKRQIAGNIYLAKVTRVEPSLQAAFVDYGGNRHGFLAFAEIHPDYYQIPVADRRALLEEERALSAAAEEEDEEPRPRRRPRSRRQAEKVQTSDAKVSAPGDTAPAASHPQPSGMDIIGADDEGDESRELVLGFTAPHQEALPALTSDELSETLNVEDESTEPYISDQTPVAAPLIAPAPSEEIFVPPASSEKRPAEEARAEVSAEVSAEAESDIEVVGADELADEIRPRHKPRHRRYKIQEVVKVRQILLVQVVKEERGNKGAALTTYLSLAGRYCVLMPNTARGGGISRKITNISDRKKLKEIAHEIEVPDGAGLIIRTAGAKRTKPEIKRDCEYLMRLWEQIRELTLRSIAPTQIYEEGDLIKRSIRDLYNREIDEVLVEGAEGYRVAKDFMKMIMPSHAKAVQPYTESTPLFARYQVESYLAGMFNPVVQLKSGGYIVIGVTEALVAIDVNSGRATKEGSIEETALRTNLEAADEVARQARLRDLAGLIVIDFIDMEERRNNTAVEKRMKDRLKTDRARIQVGGISGFGLLEMSRQRLHPGMLESTTQPCPHCHGTGLIRSDDSMALGILRALEEEGPRNRSREVLVKAPMVVANYLFNNKREHIALIETRYNMAVRIEGDPALISPDYTLEKLKVATRSLTPLTQSHVISGDASIMGDLPEEESVQDTALVDSIDAETQDDAEPKKKRKRRRRRKGGGAAEGAAIVSGETNGDAEAEAPVAVVEGEPAQEGPTSTDAVQETQGESGSTSDGTSEAREDKPKRVRRSRKKPLAAEPVVDQSVDTAAPESVAEESAPTAEEASAPQSPPKAPRKRAPRKKAAPKPEIAAANEGASAQNAAETLPQPPQEAAPPAPALAPEVVSAPEPKSEPPAVVEAAPTVLEPAAATPQEPEAPPAPKRRGWWSLRRS